MDGRSSKGEARRRLRWTGLLAFVDRLTVRLARSPDGAELEEVARAIEGMSRRMEMTIEREGVAPDELTAATRELRGWLAWMAARENLGEYVSAVGRAREALAEAAARARKKSPASFLIEFRPSRNIYKLRHGAGGEARVTFTTPMVRFDEPAVADLGAMIYGGDRTARRRVIERMHGEEYGELLGELAALGGVAEQTLGSVHDLAESFGRVNAAYFGGAMGRPHLSWSRSLTRRKFGHYDHVRDWVMVSSTLDQPGVPAFVVDFLMYHELLHKKHGVRWSASGRGYAHTAAFYADERRFEGSLEAEGWLKRLAGAGGA
jgi:hypothetical protein